MAVLLVTQVELAMVGLRNMFGEWLIGFYGSCGVASNLMAEFFAIFHGLDLAWNSGFWSVILESDSKTALDLIQEDVNQFHPYAPLVKHIRIS